MHLRSKVFMAALAGMGLIVSSASAATVHYTLDLQGPGLGNFALYADVSLGDNAGLAVFGVPLTGTVLTLDNASPQVTFAQKAGPPAFNGTVGFTNIRSADVGGLDPTVVGAQDTVNAAAPNNLVYGYGQTADSFAGQGFVPVFGEEGSPWAAHLLLATGTYDPVLGTLGFNTGSTDLVANVLAQEGSAAAPSADVTTQVIPFIPEPATVTLLGLAAIGIFGFLRRR